MKRTIYQAAAIAAVVVIAAVNSAPGFAPGDQAFARAIDTQSMLIRHTATKQQQEAAERNAKAYLARLSAEKKQELKKKKIRYLAVPTIRSKETSPKATDVLMIWDVPREALVGKTAYELTTTPKTGNLASYDNLVAEYIGKQD